MSVIYTNNKVQLANNKAIYHKWDIGNGLKFDGVNDYVLGTNASGLNFGTSDFSFSIIIKTTNILTTASLYEKWCDDITNFGQGIEVFVNNTGFVGIGLFESLSRYVNIRTQINTISPNILYTINIIKTSSSIQIYVNNILQSVTYNWVGTPQTLSTINVSTTAKYYVGVEAVKFNSFTYFLNYYYNSIIYDLKVFNKELTQAEVTEIYLKQGQIVPSTAIANLQLDYRFDNKSGTVLTDKSTNGYNGTLVNYAAGTTELGATNSWVDKYGSPILQY